MVSQNYGVNISVITYCVHFPVNCFWETVYSVCATHTSAELWIASIYAQLSRATKLLLIILTNRYLTDKKIKTVSQINGGSELVPAHGGKRQVMAPERQVMAENDRS